jgi:hypothetical protein
MNKYEALFRGEFPELPVRTAPLWRAGLQQTIVIDAKFPGPVPGEMRPMTWKQFYLRWRLPYGVWTCEDGRKVLFNRYYVPIWQQRPGHAPERANHFEWVLWKQQGWFFDDGLTPWDRPAVRRNIEAALAAFLAGEWSFQVDYDQ